MAGWIYVFLDHFYRKTKGTRYSKDGQLTILKDPQNLLEETQKETISFKITPSRKETVFLRKGMVLCALGEIRQVSSQSVFYMQDWEIVRSSSIRKLLSSTGEQRGTQEPFVYGIHGSERSLPDVFTQDVRDMYALLRKASFNESMETAWSIIDYFSSRAKRQGFDSVTDMILTNPFVLAEMEEFSFTEAKKLASNLQIELSPQIKAYTLVSQTVAREARKGNSFIPTIHVVAQLRNMKEFQQIKEKDESDFEALSRLILNQESQYSMSGIAKLSLSGKKEVGVETSSFYTAAAIALGNHYEEKSKYYGEYSGSGIYMAGSYFAEQTAAKLFANRLATSNLYETVDIDEMVKSELISLVPEQRKAFKNALAYRTSVIIGQAGTGKTHTIKALVQYCQKNGKEISVIAPSAIAASVAGSKANLSHEHFFTIHRFANIYNMNDDLGVSDSAYHLNEQSDEDMENLFQSAAFLVVDEVSMCSITVFCRLLHAIKDNPNLHLILIGDPGQLTAIGPSGFFHQIAAKVISSDVLPVTELKAIQRIQDASSSVLSTAIKVRNEGAFDIENQNSIYLKEPEKLCEKVSALLNQGISFDQIMILSDQRNGLFGTKKLNRILRKHLGIKECVSEAMDELYIGDPVVSIRNDYVDTKGTKQGKIASLRYPGRSQDVYNGMRGRIISATGEVVTVEWNDKSHENSCYNLEELPYWIEAAYAITVHKAQGSEAEFVFFVPANEQPKRITRNMLYTALTRAKKEVYLFAPIETWQQVANNIQMLPYAKFAFLVNKHLESSAWKTRSSKTVKERKKLVSVNF